MIETSRKKIIMACDRTGGHVYPAQVLADYITKTHEKYEIIFCGLRDDDAQRMTELGYQVSATKLVKRKHIALEIIISLYEAILIIYKYRPDCIVGFGGRASFFLVVLGRIFSKTVLYEPNAVYGRSNKLLSLFSRKVFLGLKEPVLDKEIKVGVPVRFKIDSSAEKQLEIKRELNLDENKKTLLVFGGSSGSIAINAAVRDIFEKDLYDDAWQLIHITGATEYGVHKEFYESYDDYNVLCKGYSRNIEKFYTVADVIVARSGASTVAELEYLAKPSVFIPYPYAYSHQFHNARVLADTKGIQIIDQKFLDGEMLWTTVNDVYKNSETIISTKYAWVDVTTFAASLYAEIKKLLG